MGLLNKKCSHCKLFIAIETEEFVFEKDKYYHYDCFIQNALEKQKTKKNKLTKEEIELKARKLQNDYLSNLQETIKKEYFIRWLQNAYNIVVIPLYIIDKIDMVLDGTYKGLSTPIPIYDLQDMWKTKKSNFDKIANYKKSINEEIDGVNRIAYDLAILISKYDSYLKWKEQQKLIEKEYVQKIVESQEQKIDYSKINNAVSINQKDETEINDLLDELF